MRKNRFGFIELLRGRYGHENGTMIVNLNNIAALIPIYDDKDLCPGTCILMNSGAELETSLTLDALEFQIHEASQSHGNQ